MSLVSTSRSRLAGGRNAPPRAGNVTRGGWGCPFEAVSPPLFSHHGRSQRIAGSGVGQRDIEGPRGMLHDRFLLVQQEDGKGRYHSPSSRRVQGAQGSSGGHILSR